MNTVYQSMGYHIFLTMELRARGAPPIVYSDQSSQWTVPSDSKVFLHGCINMREKEILTSVIKIQKNKNSKIINQEYL